MTMIRNTNLAHHLDVVSGEGIVIRLLLETDTVNEDGASVGVVEFYDLRWRKDFGPNGQFLQRFTLPELLNGVGGELVIRSGAKRLALEHRVMSVVRIWLRNMRDAARARERAGV